MSVEGELDLVAAVVPDEGREQTAHVVRRGTPRGVRDRDFELVHDLQHPLDTGDNASLGRPPLERAVEAGGKGESQLQPLALLLPGFLEVREALVDGAAHVRLVVALADRKDPAHLLYAGRLRK